MDIHFYHHFDSNLVIKTEPATPAELAQILTALADIQSTLGAVLEKENTQMATNAEILAKFQEGLADVKANTTLLGSLDDLFAQIKQQQTDALSKAGADTVMLQAASDIIDAAQSQKAAIVASINANTPHATQNDVDASAHIGEPAATPPETPAPVDLPVAQAS